MTTRQLSISIDNAGLTALAAAGQQIVLARPPSGSAYLVAWRVFAPVMTSTVSWSEGLGAYASTTPVTAGEQLRVVARTEVAGGNTYPFAGGQFGAGTPDQPPTTIRIRNNDPDLMIDKVAMMTAGLSQPATVNDTTANNPVNAQAILYQQQGVVSPTERLLIFTAGGVTAGTLLDQRWFTGSASAAQSFVLGQPLTLDFTSQLSQTVSYQSSTNRFVPDPTG